jgi:curved DNA-binding protein CbpA
MKNYYQILGVSKKSDNDTIKEAYRRKALQYHPDKNSSSDASSNFQLISEAYSVLKDPYKKGRYDYEFEQQSFNNNDYFNLSMNNAFSMFDQLFSNTVAFHNKRTQPRGLSRQFSFQEPSLFSNQTENNSSYYSYSSQSSSVHSNGTQKVSQSYMVNNNGHKNQYHTKYEIDSTGKKIIIKENGNRNLLSSSKSINEDSYKL